MVYIAVEKLGKIFRASKERLWSQYTRGPSANRRRLEICQGTRNFLSRLNLVSQQLVPETEYGFNRSQYDITTSPVVRYRGCQHGRIIPALLGLHLLADLVHKRTVLGFGLSHKPFFWSCLPPK